LACAHALSATKCVVKVYVVIVTRGSAILLLDVEGYGSGIERHFLIFGLPLWGLGWHYGALEDLRVNRVHYWIEKLYRGFLCHCLTIKNKFLTLIAQSTISGR
jgi:hypothetical protein